MPTFKYMARLNPKERKEGAVEADTRVSAAQKLINQGIFPISIEKTSDRNSNFGISGLFRFRKVNLEVLSQFTENFANLLEGGISLGRTLELLKAQMSHPLLRDTIEGINMAVTGGKSLTQALSAYPKVFSDKYLSMVKVGEETGLLSEMLGKLSKSLDEEYQLRSKMKAAMVYPVFLGFVGLSTVIILMVVVIPKFTSFFVSLKHQLPLPTRLLIEISSGLAKFGPFVLIVCVLSAVLFIRMLKNRSFRIIFDKLCLGIPVIGSFIIKSQSVSILQTMGILLSHGVNLLRAIDISAETLSNRYMAQQVRKVKDGIVRGEKLHDCFAKSQIFPQSVVGVIAIGQESGTLPQVLNRLASQYEKQMERQIKTITTMIEPVMILTMGSIVGFIVISMLMPIFKASALVQ